MKTDQIASMQNPVNDLPSDIFSSKVLYPPNNPAPSKIEETEIVNIT